MRVFRIERKKYLSTTMLGIGASMSNGFRWNSKHTHLVYTAASRSLAMLEVSVHLDWSEDLPTDRYFVEIDIPDDIEIAEISPEDLPFDWDAKPPSVTTQYIGDDFVYQEFAAVLKVPSAIISQEFNFLINPSHPDAKKVTIVSSEKMAFDKRWKI